MLQFGGKAAADDTRLQAIHRQKLLTSSNKIIREDNAAVVKEENSTKCGTYQQRGCNSTYETKESHVDKQRLRPATKETLTGRQRKALH